MLQNKKDLIFILIGLAIIALLMFAFKTGKSEFFDAESDMIAQYNPIVLNLFYIGFSQFYSNDFNTYNSTQTHEMLKKEVYISPTDLYIACDFTENINKTDILNCNQINILDLSTSYTQNKSGVSLTNPKNSEQESVYIFDQEYFFACKTINFTDCLIDTSILPVQNLITISNFLTTQSNTYNSQFVKPLNQYLITFKNTNMCKFVFCRPMIISIPPWGLFRVIHQSSDRSTPNNCMNFYNSQSNLNVILVECIQPITHNFKTQNANDTFSISPNPIAVMNANPDPINEQQDITVFYLNFNYLPTPLQNNTITQCGSFLLHMSSRNKSFSNISGLNQAILFKLSNVVDSTILSTLNLYLVANDNPTLCINSQCTSGNNYFPTKKEFDMTRKFDKFDIFISFSKYQITIVIFTLAGTTNNHLLKRYETKFAVQSTSDVMDAEYDRLAGQGFMLSPLIGSSNLNMSRYCIPNFEQLGTDLGYII